jgi:hypothetical protein
VTWVSWRLQRTETIIAAAVLALIAALLIPTGLNMAAAYVHDGLSTCANQNTLTCHEAANAFANRYESLNNLLSWVNLIPGIIGVLLAAPLLLDLDNGTVRLAWTQGVTRSRWLATRLGVAIAVALLSAGALTFLVSWWREPLDRLGGRMAPDTFDFEGIVALGYVLFAFALALAIGAVWRRTVPAVILGLGGYIAARLITQGWARQLYVSPVSRIIPASSRGPNLDHAWLLSSVLSDRSGHAVTLSPAVQQACSTGRNSFSGSCFARQGAGFVHEIFQPASRFWTLQGIETGIFAGLAVALIVFAAWWIHERAN